ncbi:MAG TPA: ABC transporter permease [Vicinamibacteria bacterium]|jgi:predicted permease
MELPLNRWIVDLFRDLVFALRLLRRQPTFTLAAVGILALAIGGQTAMFSVVDATLLRPLPYRDPGDLVVITHETPGAYSTSLPFLLLDTLRRDARSLDGLACHYQNTGISRVTLTGGSEPEAVKAGFVTADTFHVLGVSPAWGRPFTSAEEAGAERVAVLGDALWRRRFTGSPAAIGSTIEIDGARTVVVGVMPPEFQFPDGSVQLWVPLTTNHTWRRDPATLAHYWWIGIGRRVPGRSDAQVEAELDAIAARAGSEPRVERVRVRPLSSGVAPASRLTLLSLFGAVGAVLLIACSNLATLLLSRGEARRRELAIRAAIGAARSRLVRQLLAESLLLAALAGAVGAALAAALVRLFVGYGPAEIPRLAQADLDVRSLLFLIGCSAATALLFGAAPALRVTESLSSRSRDGDAAPGAGRLRAALSAVQLALAVILLGAAALLMRSFVAARSVELGFEPSHTLLLRARLPETMVAHQVAYQDDVLGRLRRLPGVDAAGAINDLFELNAVPSLALRAIFGRDVEGMPRAPLKWTAVAGDYFRAVGGTLREGRSFDDRDTASSPRVVVVDESFARRFFPGGSAVGMRFKGNDPRGRDDEWLTIVGVVRDMRRQGLEKASSPHVFEWAAQSGAVTPDLLVRTRATPAALAASVRAAVREADPSAIVSTVGTLDEALSGLLDTRRFQSGLLGVFALLALGLAAFGAFGVVHYAAARRTREVGIRMALGATPGDVAGLFLKQSAAPLLAGGTAGLLGSLAVARALSGLLFGVSPLDPLTHASSLGVLLLGAFAASAIPALRAARMDPLLALRQD